jgi:hypothetical protein
MQYVDTRAGSGGSGMSENIRKITSVISFFNTPSLKLLLRREHVIRDFFRFVHRNHLRLEAIEILERRLGLDKFAPSSQPTKTL